MHFQFFIYAFLWRLHLHWFARRKPDKTVIGTVEVIIELLEYIPSHIWWSIPMKLGKSEEDWDCMYSSYRSTQKKMENDRELRIKNYKL